MNQQTQQISPDLIKKSKMHECEHCKCVLFDATIAVVNISKILSPTGKEIELPIIPEPIIQTSGFLAWENKILEIFILYNILRKNFR